MRTVHLAKNGERGAFPGTGQRTRRTDRRPHTKRRCQQPQDHQEQRSQTRGTTAWQAPQDTAVGRKHRGGRIATDGRDFLGEEHLRQCHLSRMSRPLELRRFGGGQQAHARPRL